MYIMYVIIHINLQYITVILHFTAFQKYGKIPWNSNFFTEVIFLKKIFLKLSTTYLQKNVCKSCFVYKKTLPVYLIKTDQKHYINDNNLTKFLKWSCNDLNSKNPEHFCCWRVLGCGHRSSCGRPSYWHGKQQRRRAAESWRPGLCPSEQQWPKQETISRPLKYFLWLPAVRDLRKKGFFLSAFSLNETSLHSDCASVIE